MNNTKTNIFDYPRKYLQELYQTSIFSSEVHKSLIGEFKGLSMMCVWLTKLCPLQCKQCFFRSNMNHDGLINEEYQFSDEGMNKLIAFINDSNNGYLMLSGGGDPMVCMNHVVRLISEAQSKRIVIVTSGFWGRTEKQAHINIERLYQAFISRKYDTPCEVVIRLSVDSFHEAELGGNEVYKNIINVFNRYYSDIKGFSLMIHTMRDDPSVTELVEQLDGTLTYGEVGESDNPDVIKIVPKKAYINIHGFTIPVGISKLFLSDLMIDLNPPYSSAVIDAVRVMTDDMENSEQGNPSYIQNSLGRKGLDFWVDYNGNVTTWFNQDWYQLFNLYVDDYMDLVQGTFSNPMTAFFLRKGYENRNNIVAEVNPLALLRAQAVNLRDYYAALLLEEDKTKLYYAIRAIQSFLGDYSISYDSISDYSAQLQEAIQLSVPELKDLYSSSDYDILVQYMDEEKFHQKQWSDLFLLIALGQYQVSTQRLEEKLKIYSAKTGVTVTRVSDFLENICSEQYQRLHKRISFMKPDAYHKLIVSENE